MQLLTFHSGRLLAPFLLIAMVLTLASADAQVGVSECDDCRSTLQDYPPRPVDVEQADLTSLMAAVEETKLLPNPRGIGGQNARIGHAVSLSGNRALVGGHFTLSAGAAVVFEYRDGQWSQMAVLEPSNGRQFDHFGFSVSLQDDRALIGSFKADVVGEDSGAAYVFDFDGETWLESAILTPTDSAAGDEFGADVSLDGDRALVGASYHDSGSDDDGAAYVFRFDGNDWIQESKLIANDALAGDRFGYSTSLDGDRALIGAWFDDHPLDPNAGSAYVFRFDGANWIQEAKLVPNDPADGDLFGVDVSLDSGLALVGSYEDDDNGDSSGSAYIFRFDGSNWLQEAKLTASDGAEGDRFGRSISLDAEEGRALVGALLHDAPELDSGAAYLFTFDGTSWHESAKLVPPESRVDDTFGQSVSVDGDRMVIGAPMANSFRAGTGVAHVFEIEGATWVPQAELTVSEGSAADVFGIWTALEGNTAIVGAANDDDGAQQAGAAYVYAYEDGEWINTGKLIASDPEEEAFFGAPIRLAGDWMMIGAHRDDERGTDSGAVYFFSFDGENWVEEAKLMGSDIAPNDQFGLRIDIDRTRAMIGTLPTDPARSGAVYSFIFDGAQWVEEAKLEASDKQSGDGFGVDLDLNGDMALIGAWTHDGAGVDSGAAYLFSFNGTTWSEDAKLTPADSAEGDLFGGSLHLGDGQALIAALADDDLGMDSGSVYVFEMQEEGWSETSKLQPSSNSAGAWFGYPLVVDGRRAAISAIRDNDATGATYYYVFNGESWVEKEKITASDSSQGDLFGWAPSLDGSRLLVGAYNNDEVGGNAGSAYFFDLNSYFLGGNVLGLTGTLVLLNNDSETVTVTADGGFSFPQDYPRGSSYSVTVAQHPAGQVCTVENGEGQILNADVQNIQVNCLTQYQIGGTVSGLAQGGTVSLLLNGQDELAVMQDGAFVFPEPLADGSAYTVTVARQPTAPMQTCSVTSSSGTVSGSEVNDVVVTCTTDTFTIGGNVDGLISGNTLVLQLNGDNELVVSENGSFEFPSMLPDGSAYSVTVFAQPTSPSLTCLIDNGAGTVAGSDVNSITVQCSNVAQTLIPCENPTVGTLVGPGRAAVYGGCADESGNFWALIDTLDGAISANSSPASGYSPEPTATVMISGNFERTVVEAMGPGYAGSCLGDMVTPLEDNSPPGDLFAVNDEAYCMRLIFDSGDRLYIRATSVIEANVPRTFRDPFVAFFDPDAAPPPIGPSSSEPERIPTLPQWMLGLLIGLLALVAIRRLPLG